VKALQKLYPQAAMVTREGLWTRSYVQGLSPQHAAELAQRVNRDSFLATEMAQPSLFLLAGMGREGQWGASAPLGPSGSPGDGHA
jgi:hypothetical protein